MLMFRSALLALALVVAGCASEDDALTTDGLNDAGGELNAPAAVEVEAVTDEPVTGEAEFVEPPSGLPAPDEDEIRGMNGEDEVYD